MKMINKLSLLATIFCCIALLGCKDKNDDPTGQTGDPANLTFGVTIANDNSGSVIVQAQATNAVVYEFDMGSASDDSDTGSSQDGRFEFVYENTGMFIIEVKAIGSNGRFLQQEKQISIISGEPATTGEGYVTPITYDGWNLVYNDEFGGNALDQSTWSFDNGNGCPNLCGWGNNELEFYRAENSRVDGGLLIIEARNETFQSNEYTSTKLITQGKKAWTYGRIDVRAKLPKGKGIWPAIWMLGTNISSVGWPSSGEIDIMEMVGGNGGEKTCHGTAHWQNENGEKDIDGGSRSVVNGLDEAFHVYTIIWTENEIRWLLDDVSYHTVDITTAGTEAFHKPFYMILNVAVGGTWPGNPNASTEFPTQMQVDYVRVFQEQ